MNIIVLIILVLMIIFTTFEKGVIGLVLAAFLAYIWTLLKRTKEQSDRIQALEDTLEEAIWKDKVDSHLANKPSEVAVSKETKNKESLIEKGEQLAAHKPIKYTSTDNIESSETESNFTEEVEADTDTPLTIKPGTPNTPKEPNFLHKALVRAWSWLSGGNVFVRVGVVLLFMGMSFLIRYAIGENLIPIELRLATVCLVAIALLVWGWLQREKKQNFSLVVQGGGIGLLYLTVFSSFSLYGVIPSGIAFPILAIIVVLAAMLAIKQNALPLALIATIGGFLAPVITSSGNNNYISLFSYYAVLNLGIFAIAWFKSWRILNLVGFTFTFIISTAWGVLNYTPENFSNVEPFIIFFFLLYVAIGVIFAQKRISLYKDYVDSSLIFGTPVLAFGLQSAMVNTYEYGVAISAACLGVFYILLATALWKKYGERLKLMSEAFLSLGVIFSTLAIPFAVDGYLTGAAWAIEGAGIVWISIRQNQTLRRLFGVLLIFGAGVVLAYQTSAVEAVVSSTAFANSLFIGCMIITISASISSWLLSLSFNSRLRVEKGISFCLVIYAILIAYVGFETQIDEYSLFAKHGIYLAIFTGILILSYSIFSKVALWSSGHKVSTAGVIPLVFAAISSFSSQIQLAEYNGYFIWPTVLLAYFYALKNALNVVSTRLLMLAHLIAATIIIGLLFWEGLWQTLLGYALLALVFDQLGKRLEWPQLKWLSLGFLPVIGLVSFAAIAIDNNLAILSNISSSVSWPFPPGGFLWPFAFAVYFYLLFQNRQLTGSKSKYFHNAGALIIISMLLWLGLAPLLLIASLLAALSSMLWSRFNWSEMRILSLDILPVMLIVVWFSFANRSFHLTDLQTRNLVFQLPVEIGFVLWPAAFALLFWVIRRCEINKALVTARYIASTILVLNFVITWEVTWHLLDHYELLNAWLMAWLPLVSLLLIKLILGSTIWPFSQYQQELMQKALPSLLLVLFLWSILQLYSSAQVDALPWLPIINPIDIVQAIILMSIVLWSKDLAHIMPRLFSQRKLVYGLLVFAFVWANVDLLRGVHAYADVPWDFSDLITSNISQTLLSLFWALSGLSLTVFASRKNARTLWFVGGVLLVVVVAKLFLIDLSAQETIERIISFTGVGLLLVAVGYFSPLPPKVNEIAPEEGL